MTPERIALIGFGAIGARVFELVTASSDPKVEIVGVLLPAGSASARHALLADSGTPVTDELQALLAARPTLVIECAGHAAIDRFAAPVLESGCDLVVASIGALADAARQHRLLEAAAGGGARITLPSGAIAGIDWLSAARASGLSEVVYRSRKPPAAWRGTPAESIVDLDSLDSARVFFRGHAREAALRYPKNANVAATVALAGLGFEATQVELIADPSAAGNIHEVEARAPVGELALRVLGLPDPRNPKTSLQTAYSIARAALDRSARVVI